MTPNNRACTALVVAIGLAVLFGALLLDSKTPVAASYPATEMVDLDVTFIERTPRYPRNIACRAGDPPMDYPCPAPQKQFPDHGETVTFTAHILNKGDTPVSQFDFTWQIDGVSVKQGTHTWQSGSTQSEILQWRWQTGPHRIRFVTDFVSDTTPVNNSREIRTDAYALSIFVEEGQYQALNQRVNLTGSRSFEDWIQAQFDQFNGTFATASYPITPQGILARVRVDKIIVGPEMDGLTPNEFRLDPDEFLNDGRWLFSDDDPTNAQGYGGLYASYADYAVNTVDWALIHELAHQLGRFDMYNIDFAPAHNLITGPHGQPLLIGHAASNSYDIMQSPGTGVWSEYHAASFNRDYGDRAGMYGAYLLDLPADNWLRIVDASSRPISGARLSVYHDENEVLDDNSLVFSGVTDSGGDFHLGANPFGRLNVAGTNATLFISVTVGGQSEYHWLEATAANLAFWRGHHDRATYTLTLGMPDNRDWTLPPLLPADTTPPTTSLVQPGGGDQISGLITFAAQASDDRAIKRIEIMVDGRPIWVFAQPPYQVGWDTAQLTDGPHSVWARAYDYALPAHVADATPVTVTIQNTTHHVFSWDFERDTDWEAWRVGWDPQWAVSSVQDGMVHIPAMTFDTSMSRWLPFVFNLTTDQVVNVRMRVSGGGAGVGQFYWTTYADSSENENKVIYFNVQGDNAWHEYTVPIGQHSLWSGRIRSIRLDPVHGAQYIGRAIDVDWIRLIDQSSTTTPTPTASPTPTATPLPGFPADTFQFSVGAQARTDQLNAVAGIAIAPDGSVYAADTANHRIMQFGSGGEFIRAWGAFGRGDGQFFSPAGLAVASDGLVYVADTYNHRMQVFTAAGVHLRSWGAFGAGSGQFDRPAAVVISGNTVYVADSGNNRIQRFTSDGTYLGAWGGTGAGLGQLSAPSGLAVAPSGAIYVADTGNHRVQIFNATGSWLGGWGAEGPATGQFDRPIGIVVAPTAVIVADTGNARIQRFTPDGGFLSSLGSAGTGPGQFNEPSGLTANAEGILFVADAKNGRIQSFNSSNTFLGMWGTVGQVDGQFDTPNGIAVSDAGRLYVADSENHRIQVFDAAGRFITSWGSRGNADGQFVFPTRVQLAPNGNVYVTDMRNHRVQYFNANGVFLGKWGAYGSGDGQLKNPGGLIIAPDGTVYVADTFNHRIQHFSATGNYLGQWGSYGAAVGQFDYPWDVAVAPDGSIIVADTWNYRLQRFTATGSYLATYGYYGTTNGAFDGPRGVSVAPDGTLYVADTWNHRIQRLSSTGDFLGKLGVRGSGDGEFEYPGALALGPDGTLYVIDFMAARWQAFGDTNPDVWRGEYFDNRWLAGRTALVRNESQVNFDWGTGAPDPNLPADGFSARWQRHSWFGAGTYYFSVVMDDGVRLWLDDQLVIDEWGPAGQRTRVVQKYLEEGYHRLRLEYFDSTGAAAIRLSWSTSPITPVPTSTATATPSATPTLTPTATTTPTAASTSTATATPTATSTSTATVTPSVTPTPTATAAPTATPTSTATVTPSVTPTPTATATPTATPTPPCCGVVGHAWFDSDGDGQREGDEFGLVGVLIRLVKAGVTIAQVTTDSTGYYGLPSVAAGEYVVREVHPTWVRFSSTSDAVPVMLVAGSVSVVDFGDWDGLPTWLPLVSR